MPSVQLQQQSVLRSISINRQTCGDHVEDVILSEPVLITGLTVLVPHGAERQVFKAWARDLSTPAAARFTPIIGPVEGPCEAAPVAQVFPTQHVVLRGKCSSATLQLVGYTLDSAPERIKAAAEAQLCPLPEAPDILPLPNLQSHQQQQLAQDGSSGAAAGQAPNMSRPLGQVLPLHKIPPAFVLILAPLAQFWGQGRILPLPADAPANSVDMQACEQMATAVLAAKRGNPSALMAKLTTTANPYGLAVDWDGIRDRVLDMATYCCSALSDNRVNMPVSVEVAMAGVCAAILLAACQDTAVQLLTSRGRPHPAAVAIAALMSIPNQPPRVQDYGTGLVDVLLESAPTLACSALQGTFNPSAAAAALRGKSVGRGGPSNHHQHDSQAAAAASGPSSQQERSAGGHGHYGGNNRGEEGGPAAKKQRMDLLDGNAGGGGGAGAQSGDVGHGCVDDVQSPGSRRQSRADVDSVADAATSADAAAKQQGDAASCGDGGGGDEAATAGQDTPSARRPGDDGDVADADGDGGERPEGAVVALDDGGGADGEQQEAGGEQQEGGAGAVWEQQQGLSIGASQEEEQLDFGDVDEEQERTDVYTGMQQDDSVEPGYEQEGPLSEEGGYVGGGQGEGGGAAGDDQQQYSGAQDFSQQQQQQQHDQQQEEDETGPEDGEYRTEDGGDYVEYEEEDAAAEAPSEPECPTSIQQQPPVPQLSRGQLYNAVLELALSPLQPDAAVSCASVLRRLRAYQCLDVLQSTIGPMLSGKVNALLLGPAELSAHVSRVAAAANDLATLVLQPVPSRHAGPALKPPSASTAAAGSTFAQQQRQEADACVLQMMLGFRTLDLLAAFVIYLGVHVCRLVQLQQQLAAEPLPSAERQQQQLDTAEQRVQLCREHAQLLGSIRALTSSLTASSGGWCYLTAAREGLAALAAAVCPTRKVCLDGGPFAPDTSAAPYDTQHGWAADRQALLAAASGLSSSMTATEGAVYGADEASASSAGAGAAGDLADSLQRLWLLVDATAELQASKELLMKQQHMYSDSSAQDQGCAGLDRLNAALLTLLKGGLASEVGEQSLVSALSASSPALRQLVLLLEHCGKVQAAAAEGQQKAKQAGGQGFLGVDTDYDPFMPAQQQERTSLIYGALHAPDILLAVVSSPHADALSAWLPLSNALAGTLKGLLTVHEKHGADAAQAAFPDLRTSAASTSAGGGAGGGVPGMFLHGGWQAAQQQHEQLLWQLQGHVMTGQRLLQFWQMQSDGSGSGSGTELLDWLAEQLPPLVAVDDGRKLRLPEEALDAAGGIIGAAHGRGSAAAPEPLVRSTAAAAVRALGGVAATAGAPPPWGVDVRSDAVVDFMRNPASRSAALAALHFLDMLLRGAPASVRTMARRLADRPRDRQAMPYALNPSVTLNPDGTLGPQGPQGWLGHAGQQGTGGSGEAAALLRDGFEARELVCELLHAGVVDALERALRTATVALRASDADLVWAVQGGSQQDLLPVLQARSAAASLMRAACSTTASLLVHLTDADAKQLEACSLLDAIVCAHTTIVTSSEGLQGCVPQPGLSPLIAKATDPALNPVQRLAADAAVSSAAVRLCSGRVLLLLEARQSLAVCLRCWQLQGWWPDPVGALLGVYPRASAVVEEFAKQAAAARAAGDPDAPPPPAPRQGPRQLLASLLGLADLCPEEWPPRGASQAAARARDAAAAADGRTLDGSPFERPSHVRLRGQLAMSLETHWERLDALIAFGISCSTRVARLALVRMLARMCGVGGGTSPQLGPTVFGALRQRLEDIIQSRSKLASKVAAIKGGPSHTAHQKQLLINREVDGLVVQLRGAIQVAEVLLPLCSAPSIKSVLTEHKAAGVLGKGVYALVRPLQDLQQLQADEAAAAAAAATRAPTAGPGLARLGVESQALAGVLLQLVGVLMDPDISMNPWADSLTRELHDTPSLQVGRAAVAYLLSAVEGLNPANMALLAGLLVGPCASGAGGVRPLYDYPKGRFVLRVAARQWHVQATGIPAAAGSLTQPELQMSTEWAAAALDATTWVGDDGHDGPDASHAASCGAIAQALRELAGSGAQEGEAIIEAERARPVVGSIPRFVTAVKTAIAAHRPGGQDSQSVASLLSQAPLLLACDAACLDFWRASAASADHLQAHPTPHTQTPHTAASPTSCGQDSWQPTQLVGLAAARVRSRGIAEVLAVAQAEGQQQVYHMGQHDVAGGGGVGAAAAAAAAGPTAAAATAGALGAGGDASEIPAIMARRGGTGSGQFGKGYAGGRVSVHVDQFEARAARPAAGHMLGVGGMQQPLQAPMVAAAAGMGQMLNNPLGMAAAVGAAGMGMGMALPPPGPLAMMGGPGGLNPGLNPMMMMQQPAAQMLMVQQQQQHMMMAAQGMHHHQQHPVMQQHMQPPRQQRHGGQNSKQRRQENRRHLQGGGGGGGGRQPDGSPDDERLLSGLAKSE